MAEKFRNALLLSDSIHINLRESVVKNAFDPVANMNILGGYLPFDGTIEFFGRVNSILKPDDVVVDLGAGRAAWYFNDECDTRRQIRNMSLRVSRLIGLDLDPAVMGNPVNTENYVIENGVLPLPDKSVDVIVSDYVLEHIVEPSSFISEIHRVLKPGGHFCARTPHRYQYVSIVARLVKNKVHANVLRFAQPDRSAEDIFPTAYRLNTLNDIRKEFASFENYSYLYVAEPSYYFGSRVIFSLLSFFHQILPKAFVGNIFIFLRKK